MEHFPYLRDLVLVYAVSGVVVYLFHRIRQSPIVGFLVTGVLVGPHGLSLISDSETVRQLAEIGVMLLLFSIGLEFSIRKLLEVKKVVLLTGPLQIVATVVTVVVVSQVLQFPLGPAVMLGFFAALSSTAMVVKILLDRGELDSLPGRVCLGILILQDLAVVPIMVLIPHLGSEDQPIGAIIQSVATAFLVIVLMFVAARWVFPRLMRQAVSTRSKELFIITALLAFLGIAWISTELGFSLALGGFLAGLILSASEYSHQIFSDIRSLRDSLNSLFFVSVGMLVDPGYILDHLNFVLGAVLLIIVGKFVITNLAIVTTGLPGAVAVVSGLSLAQTGEFSFIILEESSRYGIFPPNWYQMLISAAVATMILTPGLMVLGRRLGASRLAGRFGSQSARLAAIRELDEEEPGIADHVILCGFGVSGRNIASVLASSGIRYTILELNPETVREWKSRGEPIHFGDCTDTEILLHAGVRTARVIVFAISDPFAMRRAVSSARNLNPELVILTRVKRVVEIDELYDLGANEVVPEEFEGSIELLTRILRLFNFPRDLIAKEIRTIREDRYGVFRDAKPTIPRLRLAEHLDVYTETVQVPEDSPLRGMRLAESDLRQKSGALILGIIRGGNSINNPTGEDHIQVRDLLVLSGTKHQLRDALGMILGRPQAGANP